MDTTLTTPSEPPPAWVWLMLLAILLFPFVLKFAFHVGAKRVSLINPQTGQVTNGYWGFSWTYLFFGWWVPLLRGELSTAALHLLFTIVTAGFWQMIACFLYNAQYTRRRIAEGFRIADQPLINQAAASALGVDLTVHQAPPAR
jgi:hypothetical protein